MDGCRERLLDPPARFTLVRCDGCGLVRPNPRPTREAIGAYYPPEYSPFAAQAPAGKRGLKGAAQNLFRRIYEARYPGAPYPMAGEPGRVVLDVGCGTGWFLQRFAEQGWETWGLEISPTAAARAADHGVEHVLQCAIEDAELPLARFDLVTFRDSIEHAFDPRLALEKAWQALKPGGIVELLTPDVNSLESRLFGRDWYALEVPRHLQLFTRETLARLLGETGFEMLRWRPTAVPRGLHVSLDYWLESRFGVRIGTRHWRHMGLYHGLMPVSLGLALAGTGMSLEVWARKR